MNNNITYIIVTADKLNDINFNEVVEEKKTIRYNLDNTEFIVKFKGDVPSDLKEYKKYTHSEIIKFINNPDNGWIKNIEK